MSSNLEQLKNYLIDISNKNLNQIPTNVLNLYKKEIKELITNVSRRPHYNNLISLVIELVFLLLGVLFKIPFLFRGAIPAAIFFLGLATYNYYKYKKETAIRNEILNLSKTYLQEINNIIDKRNDHIPTKNTNLQENSKKTPIINTEENNLKPNSELLLLNEIEHKILSLPKNLQETYISRLNTILKQFRKEQKDAEIYEITSMKDYIKDVNTKALNLSLVQLNNDLDKELKNFQQDDFKSQINNIISNFNEKLSLYPDKVAILNNLANTLLKLFSNDLNKNILLCNAFSDYFGTSLNCLNIDELSNFIPNIHPNFLSRIIITGETILQNSDSKSDYATNIINLKQNLSNEQYLLMLIYSIEKLTPTEQKLTRQIPKTMI